MKNIVVIRPDAIGDSLVTFPILVALREKYAPSHITFIGNAAAMPLAKAWGIADEVYSYDKQWTEVFSPLNIHLPGLREAFLQTDLAVSFALDTELAKQNLLAAGVKEVITVPIFFKELIQISDVPLHVVQYFAKWIGVPVPEPERIVLPNTGSEAFHAYIPPIALHPGSGSAYRRWPVSSFAKLIISLMRKQYPILLLAGPSESELLAKILREVHQSIPKVPQSGMLTILDNAPLLQVAQQLKQCGCFVGHDTATSHLAGLLRIPTLALFGDTYPDRWRPLGPTVEIIQKIPLERLSVERVLESVLRMYHAHQ
ncbi:MAG TPA: glycosyltransferase family 9 protein [Ktedonobacteraceae bacterium]|nr:glycosyltransferase family 9 protein [Ktedonobacteraceae bacterium]